MKEYPQTTVHRDSDWTAMYVVLGVIPLLFVCSVVYSSWRDRMREKRLRDLETETVSVISGGDVKVVEQETETISLKQ
jgi:hypothetical protein